MDFENGQHGRRVLVGITFDGDQCRHDTLLVGKCGHGLTYPSKLELALDLPVYDIKTARLTAELSTCDWLEPPQLSVVLRCRI